MHSFKERYQKLNKEQKMAVDSIEGPVLVVAGPGSGKTEILSLRVANILQKTDTKPSNILCLTFTESAAVNMRERLSKLIGQDAYRVTIYTFHSFGSDIIGKYPEYFYNGASFSPADKLMQMEVMTEIFNSLPLNNPLKVEHPEQGYIYLESALKAISGLKKTGLMPEEFEQILAENSEFYKKINPLLQVFDDRISEKIYGDIKKLIKELKSFKTEKNNFGVRPLSQIVADSLERALEKCQEDENTKALSAWKEKWIKKDENGKRVFKDFLNVEKLASLSKIYKKYLESMYLKGYYDFDDMLLQTIHCLEKNPVLKYELQEQYQYILVDEFQDTNEAQMRLLRIIADAEVNEGRPNIMAVGDDDQAVYKFQGAEISNILDFRDSFDGVKIVTLKNNYRSTQDILDVATHVIRKGEERLENVVPEIQKTIVASNKNIKGGLITGKIFPTNVHEYSFIAKEIKKLIEEGKDPKEIAVISRNHRELEEIAPYLANNGIAINYERQQNVLAEPHIHQLITIAKFINSLNKKEKDEADELLPEILSYPFWQFERKDVWEISLKAKSGEKLESWLDVMLKSEKKKIRNIAKFFLELSKQAEYEPLETMLDKMIGSHTALLADTEDDDDCGESFYRFKNNAFFSPFKDYYFSREIFNNKKVEYLVFLSGLRVFVQSLREYKNGQELKIKDLVEFVDLHEKNEIPINDESPFANAYEAVNLLTSHKAKGLEFEVVFVLSCQEDIWAGRGRGNNLPFPQNLPVYPAGENLDDQLRLFYVALTRAKSHLYLTSYEKNSAGKESLRLQFLIPGQSNNQKMKDILNPLAENFSVSLESLNMPVYSWLNYYKLPRLEEEEILLKLLVKDYQMSVTHLNNFLNVEKGGPQLFMEQNLLRFPQSKTPSGCYGSAVHKSFEILYTQLRKNGKILPLKDLLLIFKNQLEKQRLSKKDFELYLEKGKLALTAYYNAKKKDFDPKNKIEVNFKNQGVVVGEAKLNGKIDKIVTEGNDMIVCDLKTGKPKLNWDGKNPYEKIQLTEYKRQLMFYKILIENSREFGGKYRVGKGILEFVEPTTSGKNIDLSLDIDNASVERLKRLIKIIYKKITELDFPSIENYSKDINGIIAFENDLLNDKV